MIDIGTYISEQDFLSVDKFNQYGEELVSRLKTTENAHLRELIKTGIFYCNSLTNIESKLNQNPLDSENAEDSTMKEFEKHKRENYTNKVLLLEKKRNFTLY